MAGAEQAPAANPGLKEDDLADIAAPVRAGPRGRGGCAPGNRDEPLEAGIARFFRPGYASVVV